MRTWKLFGKPKKKIGAKQYDDNIEKTGTFEDIINPNEASLKKEPTYETRETTIPILFL